jgi:hypothetical protein
MREIDEIEKKLQIKKISDKLQKQFLKDLNEIMLTPLGRRVFSYLIEFCGQNQTSFTGNSDTYRREGQRNVALMLITACKFNGLACLELLHIADTEYTELQMAIGEEIKKKGGDKNG